LEILPEEYTELERVVEQLQGLGGPELAKDLNEEDHGILTQRLSSTCKHIHTAPHARPMDVLHNTRHVLKNIGEEVSYQSNM
jgi:hypothetical protein